MSERSSIQFPFKVALGPYVLDVEFVAKSDLYYKNRNWYVDFNRQTIQIAHHLDEKSLLTTFLMAVVGIIHYTHGMDDTCTEEAFTHSFSSGMLEFISRNPGAWNWLNLSMSRVFKSPYAFHRLVSGQLVMPAKAPEMVKLHQKEVRLQQLPAAVADKDNVWGYYYYGDQTVNVHEALKGKHFSVIFLHELTHAFHHSRKMRKRETRRRFVRVQVECLMSFVQKNPEAWAWFISRLCEIKRKKKVSAKNLPKAA